MGTVKHGGRKCDYLGMRGCIWIHIERDIE